MQTENRQDFVRKNLSTQKSAKDKFKPTFCGKEFYIDHQNDFTIIQKNIHNLSQKNSVIIWTIALCCLRRKHDWFAGLRKNARTCHTQNKNNPLDFSIYALFKDLNISWPQKLDRLITFESFISNIKIKAVPESAISGLFHFYTDDYNLSVLNYEPKPFEILKYQLSNQRVLTFENDYTQWPEKKYGERDVLSFLLHDFIHAEHFFSDPIKRDGQLNFYFFIEKILCHKILDQLLLNTQFLKQFSYLISDMNSHVLHLIKTLKAIIDEQNDSDDCWFKIGQMSTSDELTAALGRINSVAFSDADTNVVLVNFQTKNTRPLPDPKLIPVQSELSALK